MARKPPERLRRALLAALLAAGCAGPRGGRAPGPSATLPPLPPAAVSGAAAPGAALSLELRRRTFEDAWQRVQEGFYDAGFGGVSWDSVRRAYEPEVARVERSREFHELLARMLASLRVSHTAVLSPERLAAERARRPGWTGAEVRRLPEGWVVFRVTPASPAAHAGLRMGDVVDSIGRLSADSVASAAYRPWLGARERLRGGTAVLNEWLAGNQGATLPLVVRSLPGGSVRRLLLRPVKHPGISVRIGSLPPTRALVEARRLEGGYGYLRFTAFVPGLEPRLRSIVAGMRNAPGLVIDLRGNPGGYDRLGDALAGMLLSYPAPLTETRLRRRVRQDEATPVPDGYRGPVAVLLDGLSASAAEQFAAPLKELGRVVVVGERSAGADLEAAVADLPTGGVMMYPIGEPRTARGSLIEGVGVAPDVEVHPTRAALAQGRDEQLEAALRELRRRAPARRP